MKLVGVSGSLVGSKILEAVYHFLNTAKAIDPTIKTELIDLKEEDVELFHGPSLSFYNQNTWDVVNKITTADFLLFSTPIYQASISGSFKNLLDYMPQNAFKGKVTGFITVGGSGKHALVGDYQLKPILSYLKGIIPNNNVFIHNTSFAEEGDLEDEKVIRRLEKLAKEMISLQKGLNVND
ncbi:FMN reductase/FAD reductase [NAD(P)H] [Salinibacillus kushneri]|uniref:FMN reductase/FAD reductase [NAD(P)H] n=1 Tax=Salinibacillus kushneri TaxID=237682 RepID=A0A1I0ABY5_9BACI|nr:NADPH-dependent FMN reductase [Salinibacillus kushneri]SES91702.1 FMN reductase/FAD reductase [NAD(P)H] [Salinibacillus kushneri]